MAVTETVVVAIVELPTPFIAERVYIVVVKGLTEVEVSFVTLPTPLSMLVDEAADTTHERTDD